MAIIAGGLLFLAWRRGSGEHMLYSKRAGKTVLQILPLLIFAFIVAETAKVVVLMEIISRWIGGESGLRGVFLGTAAGMMTPCCTGIGVTIAASFLRSGASIGTIVAYITGISLLTANRLPMEISIIGWRFTTIRFTCTFFFPIIAGLMANSLFSQVNLGS
jgi:uncharacterized membrane protein YraQ (UPF0718 family)